MAPCIGRSPFQSIVEVPMRCFPALVSYWNVAGTSCTRALHVILLVWFLVQLQECRCLYTVQELKRKCLEGATLPGPSQAARKKAYELSYHIKERTWKVIKSYSDQGALVKVTHREKQRWVTMRKRSYFVKRRWVSMTEKKNIEFIA